MQLKIWRLDVLERAADVAHPPKKNLQGFPPNLNKLARGATRNIAKAGEGELGVGVGDGGR